LCRDGINCCHFSLKFATFEGLKRQASKKEESGGGKSCTKVINHTRKSPNFLLPPAFNPEATSDGAAQ